jgi:hypothetical protein
VPDFIGAERSGNGKWQWNDNPSPLRVGEILAVLFAFLMRWKEATENLYICPRIYSASSTDFWHDFWHLLSSIR